MAHTRTYLLLDYSFHKTKKEKIYRANFGDRRVGEVKKIAWHNKLILESQVININISMKILLNWVLYATNEKKTYLFDSLNRINSLFYSILLLTSESDLPKCSTNNKDF